MNEITMRIPKNTEYDRLMDVTHEDNDLSHWKKMLSWVNDKENKYELPASSRAARGYNSGRCWYYYTASYRDVTVGFRPAFDLTAGTLSSDIRDGDAAIIGTLYMNDVPVRVPQNPTRNGDIVDYIPDAKLELREPMDDPDYQVKAVYIGNKVCVADRVLLKNISYEALGELGLESGVSRAGKEPVRELRDSRGNVWTLASTPKTIRILDVAGVAGALLKDLDMNRTPTQSGDGYVTGYYAICEVSGKPDRCVSVSLIQRRAMEPGDTPYMELHVVDDVNGADCYLKDVEGLSSYDIQMMAGKTRDAVANTMWEIIAATAKG